MKFIISENKIQSIALNWLDTEYNPKNLDVYKNKRLPGSLFYVKNGKLVYQVDKQNRNFLFDYNEIYEFLKSFLSLKTDDILDIMDYWFEKNFNEKEFSILEEYLNDWFDFSSTRQKENWVKV